MYKKDRVFKAALMNLLILSKALTKIIQIMDDTLHEEEEEE
jgi:hypothetical protein